VKLEERVAELEDRFGTLLMVLGVLLLERAGANKRQLRELVEKFNEPAAHESWAELDALMKQEIEKPAKSDPA
jgi:TorA maturation chaperone TorD